MAWRCAVLKVTLLTGTRPVALLTPSAGQRSRSVGVLMASRITYCFSYFLIHKPEIPLKISCLLCKSVFTTDSSRSGVRANINTPDTETSMLEVHLSLRAIFAFVALFWPPVHDSEPPLGATDFSLHQPRPDHGNLALPLLLPFVHHSKAGCTQLFVFGTEECGPLSVRSHPEPTAINASFVQALRPSPPSWCRQNLSCARRLSP